MNLIINIPDDVYTRLFDNGIQDNEIATDDICEMARALRLGIPIHDNATNGDVMKALFPTADISLNDSCFEGVVNKYGFDMKWWNSPYQKGGK